MIPQRVESIQPEPGAAERSPDAAERSPDAAPAALRVRANVWLERRGRVVISDFRARLLEAVVEHGSVAAAAATLDLPYRTAWKKLDEMEEASGEPLVERGSGGRGGGRSHLTEAGTRLLGDYRSLTDPVGRTVRAEAGRLGLQPGRGLAERPPAEVTAEPPPADGEPERG